MIVPAAGSPGVHTMWSGTAVAVTVSPVNVGPAVAIKAMTIQPITYRGRTVAAATRSRFFLAERLDQRPASDPERTFVIFMCADAADH